MGSAILRNRYRVLGRLGTGGGGSVYAVEDVGGARSPSQQLALKALFAGRDQGTLLTLLQQEFRVLATLRHPMIARVYDFGRIPEGSGLEGAIGRSGYFYTRDLVDGEDLGAYCAGRSVAEICEVCRQTAGVLDVLHRAGMVHRDFKPGNVIVSPEGRPHLIDFGLAQDEGETTQASGTAAFMAPEMLRGELVDRRADLYAFGISLYALLVGELPRPQALLGEIVNWHLTGEPLRITPQRDVPPELDRLVERLTHRQPDQRYPSAREVALALGEICTGLRGEQIAVEEPAFVPPATGATLSEPLAQLEQAVHGRTLRASAGPSLIAVVGDPGAGKTRLLRELAWRCQLTGVEVIRGEFHAGDPRPYALLNDLLAQVSGLLQLDNPLVDPEPSADRYALFQRITDTLARAAARLPLLLLIDGVDQADDESLAALRFISHTLEPTDRVLMIAGYHTDERIDAALGDPEQVTLAPLPPAEVERMLADASQREDPALAGRIHERTGGNPQFVLEVLLGLHTAGWPANPDLDKLLPPRGLEEMYARKWSELPADQRDVLAAAAVLGRPARGAALLELLDTDHSMRFAPGTLVGLPLEALEASWLVRRPDGTWAFRQAPAAHYVYLTLPDGYRRQLHLAAAARVGDADRVERTRHALAGEAFDLARETLPDALATLGALGAHGRAAQLCEQAIALCTDGAERNELRFRLGELFRTTGDFKRAQQELELACAGTEGDALARTRIALAHVYRAAGDAESSLAVLAQVLDAPGKRDAALTLAAHAGRVATLATRDDHEAVLAAVEEALAIESGSGRAGRDPAIRAELRGHQAWSLGQLGQYDRATDAFGAALADARAADDRRTEATILNRWAAVAARHVDYDRVAERYDAALACARAIADVERVAAIRFNLAVFHLRRGQYAACLGHLHQSLRLFEAMGAEQNAATARCNLGFLELKLGLYEQARVTLERAIERMRRLGRRSGEASGLLFSALVSAHRGRPDDARGAIAEACRIYGEAGQHNDVADALLDLAEVELLDERPLAALEALGQAAEQANLSATPHLHVRATVLRARASAREGGADDRGAVLSELQQALTDARRLDAPELIWHCHTAAMELYDAIGQYDRAASHAVAAASILEKMAEGLPTEVRAAFWQDRTRRAVRDRATSETRQAKESPMSEQITPSPDALWATLPAAGPPAMPGSGSLASAPGPASASGMPVHERFYRLLEIYRRINAELDPERLLGLVMDTAVELTGAERGFLLLGEAPDALKVEVARNLDPDRGSGGYSRSIAERVAASGLPVITVSACNDPRFSEYASVHQLQLESVLCIPIHARDRLTGVLYMESRFQSGRFTPEDQRLLMAFGDQVAIALTNARLLADNMRKATELERANREIEALAEERGRLLSQRTQQLADAQRDLAETRARLESQTGRFGMIGCSAQLRRVFEMIDRVSVTDVPVLIEGESGTGKEMVARALHESSPRAAKRLVSLNCAAIPEGLLESELFGHVRGAFTGADRDRKGVFQAADGGTLFLDEIGDMPPRMQVDLLRALQEKTIRPVGGQKSIEVDVRVVAATNKPLADLVKRGTFREDLFYRLHVVRLELPPLRERTDDVPLLVEHFLQTIGARMKREKRGVTKRALRRLMAYGWPGNVRQLEHAVMNAVVLADGDVLDEDDFSLEAPLAEAPPTPSPSQATSAADRQSRERDAILEALERCNWNKSRAAEVMGIPRRTFYRRLRAHGIQ